MQPEPRELQILRQLLGHERGSDVFGLYTLAATCAQFTEQIAQQQAELARLGSAPSPDAAPAEQQNPWTAPADQAAP